MIRTTINIDAEVYRRLKDEAAKRGVDLEDVIIALMRYYSKKYRRELVAWDAVRYQERMDNGSRECVHVSWFGGEYEFLIDLRKVHKKSVSYLIAEAVLTLLDNISLNFDHYLDNYQHQTYTIAKFSIQNVIGCLFLWGTPIRSIK